MAKHGCQLNLIHLKLTGSRRRRLRLTARSTSGSFQVLQHRHCFRLINRNDSFVVLTPPPHVCCLLCRWDPESNRWSLVCPMSVARLGAGVEACGGALYVVGGFDGLNRWDTAEKYQPETNTLAAAGSHEHHPQRTG